MANNTTLIPLVQADIDALDGTQTLGHLIDLKIAAVKLGMDTAAINIRLDALDMSAEDTEMLMENAVANTLSKPTEKTLPVNPAHAPFMQQGDSLVFNRLKGQVELARFYANNRIVEGYTNSGNATMATSALVFGPDDRWLVAISPRTYTSPSTLFYTRGAFVDRMAAYGSTTQRGLPQSNPSISGFHISSTLIYLTSSKRISDNSYLLFMRINNDHQPAIIMVTLEYGTDGIPNMLRYSSNYLINVPCWNNISVEVAGTQSIVLNDGRVLIVLPRNNSQDAGFIFDPATGTLGVEQGAFNLCKSSSGATTRQSSYSNGMIQLASGNIMIADDVGLHLLEYSGGVFTHRLVNTTHLFSTYGMGIHQQSDGSMVVVQDLTSHLRFLHFEVDEVNFTITSLNSQNESGYICQSGISTGAFIETPQGLMNVSKGAVRWIPFDANGDLPISGVDAYKVVREGQAYLGEAQDSADQEIFENISGGHISNRVKVPTNTLKDYAVAGLCPLEHYAFMCGVYDAPFKHLGVATDLPMDGAVSFVPYPTIPKGSGAYVVDTRSTDDSVGHYGSASLKITGLLPLQVSGGQAFIGGSECGSTRLDFKAHTGNTSNPPTGPASLYNTVLTIDGISIKDGVNYAIGASYSGLSINLNTYFSWSLNLVNASTTTMLLAIEDLAVSANNLEIF
jgi:hypothetical protein